MNKFSKKSDLQHAGGTFKWVLQNFLEFGAYYHDRAIHEKVEKLSFLKTCFIPCIPRVFWTTFKTTF